MARVRHIEIQNFRCIAKLEWTPSPGINCLIGPGDSGKSSLLDAVDFCLGARRTLQFKDADFYSLDVANPIVITITIGELDDALKSIDVYGLFLRSFNPDTRKIDDEPEHGCETVLSLRLTVGSDLEPVWSLVSERAIAQEHSRYLSWADRLRLSPTRIGALADYHLGWRRGSVLNRISDERADSSAALARAAREARAAFGDHAEIQLGKTLELVSQTAKELGISTGEKLKAMLDAHSVSFGGGTIALHGDDGVPLRALGVGSTRLLIAGLQRKAASEASVVLIDELEHGLEPHRIIRLLGSIGAKDREPPLQAFVTTHSPVAVRELSGSQLFLLRKTNGTHQLDPVGNAPEVQGTIRVFPEAFLAPQVIVCEGASEVGFLRGIDRFRVANGKPAFTALGVALVDAGGCDKIYARANPILALGYRVAVLRDDDKQPNPEAEAAFIAAGGKLVAWRPGKALEDELFDSVSEDAVLSLLGRAVQLHGEELIQANIASASQNRLDLLACRAGASEDVRKVLGKASRSKSSSWFKSVTAMDDVAHDIVGPDLQQAVPDFVVLVNSIFEWMSNAA